MYFCDRQKDEHGVEDMSSYPFGSGIQKLTTGQIATRSTWGRVPETDTIKAASHMIRMVPANHVFVTQVNELDPGTIGMTAGEGRGWFEPNGDHGRVCIHGRCLR